MIVRWCAGLHWHSTVVVWLDRVVLGMLDQQSWARDPEGKTSERSKERPIKQNESFKCFAGMGAAREAWECKSASRAAVGFQVPHGSGRGYP